VNATTKAAITTSRVDAPNQKYNPAKYEKNPYFRVAVGASPLAVRASKPLDLYDPARRPVYNLDNLPYPPLTNEKEYVAWMLKHYPTETAHFLRWRWQRASIAVARHRITHRRVLEAFLLTPREWFVRKYNLDKTYSNTAIPIGFGQTISGPDLVSNMTNALDPQPNQKVLEIGTGSGYQSAFLSSLSNYCYTIEIVRPLAEQTNQIYLQHTKAMPQFANIHRRAADGYFGWPKYAPFDRIIVTTGIDHIPPELLRELKPGGIMVIPVGPPTGQVVLKITKTVDKNGQIHLTREDIYHGLRKEIFVPFTAASGGTHNTGGAKRSAK
jgi:protein-L-isoaspartate(D-aspartate) O-methyltransferase